MNKHRFWFRITAVLATVILLLNCYSVAAYDEINENIPMEEISPVSSASGNADVMPLDIDYGSPYWEDLTKAVTPMYAPYGTGCASLGITLPAGKGVVLMGREYGYFYVYWYNTDGKEVFGYIPIDSVDTSGYEWIQYDIYGKGICDGTTEVLSYAGTLMRKYTQQIFF